MPMQPALDQCPGILPHYRQTIMLLLIDVVHTDWQFFLPLTCVSICIQYNKDGRPSGDADVDFASHEEAQEAMRRNKALMRELFTASVCHSAHTCYCFRSDFLGIYCFQLEWYAKPECPFSYLSNNFEPSKSVSCYKNFH